MKWGLERYWTLPGWGVSSYCYFTSITIVMEFFKLWGVTAEIGDRFLLNIRRTGLFNSQLTSKLMALVLLVISLLGSRGKKEEKINRFFESIKESSLIWFSF